MRWVISFMAMLPVIDVLERWYLARDVDYAEGDLFPARRICWGTCRGLDGRTDFRYFLLRLPSYVWLDGYDGRHRFYQRVLLRFAGKWRVVHISACDAVMA
jgi:hypothetical protein